MTVLQQNYICQFLPSSVWDSTRCSLSHDTAVHLRALPSCKHPLHLLQAACAVTLLWPPDTISNPPILPPEPVFPRRTIQSHPIFMTSCSFLILITQNTLLVFFPYIFRIIFKCDSSCFPFPHHYL